LTARAVSRGSRRTPRARRTGALRPGLTLIGDKGFADRKFEDLVTTGFGVRLVRSDRRDETPRHGSIGWIRQWIESVNGTARLHPAAGGEGARPPRCQAHRPGPAQ
jgi:hypothetical protein